MRKQKVFRDYHKTNPIYDKVSVSCHQDWINLYWNFRTKEECLSKIKKLKKRFPRMFLYRPTEEIIWLNSTIDTGERYYSLRGSAQIEMINQFFDKNI